jgi:hypothetical protein
VGWALLAVIGVLGVGLFAQAYATYSIVQSDRPLPLATFGAARGWARWRSSSRWR